MLNLVDAGARFGARCVAPSSEGVHGLAWDLVRPKPYDLAFQNNSDVICLLFGAIDARTGYDGAPRPKGRVLLPKDACETMSDGGEVAVRTMSSAARRDGVDIRTGYRVQRVVRNEADEIVGVEANGASGKGLAVRARKSTSARRLGRNSAT